MRDKLNSVICNVLWNQYFVVTLSDYLSYYVPIKLLKHKKYEVVLQEFCNNHY